MFKHTFVPLLIIASVFLFIFLPMSCGVGDSDGIRETVDSFSNRYFNWQFQKAMPYVDKSSERWLSFAASQVSAEDVDSLKNMQEGASIKIKDVEMKDDSSAVASVIVSHFLALDSIGGHPQVAEESTFLIDVARRNGAWKVVLNGLPK